MPWYITDGILKRTNAAPSIHSIPTNITGEGAAVIPEGVTALADHVFFECTRLTSVTFPESLTRIQYSAFRGCTCLKLTLPESIIHIGELAFWGCSCLTLSARLFALLDPSTPPTLQAITCPISLKEVPAAVRAKLCVGFALNQEAYPDELRTQYLTHIRKNAAKLTEAAFDFPELLYLMCDKKLLSARVIDTFTEEALRRRNTELTALILSYQNDLLRAEDIVKARRHREKL